MKARVYLLGLVVFCSACAAPSLRYKSDVSRLMAQGKFQTAADTVAAKSHKMYARQDNALAYLDQAALLHDAANPAQSDKLLAQAQARIEELYTVSATRSAGRLLINDLTLPYEVSAYERAFTYFYRAMNFLDQHNLMDAAVEARKASAFLDQLRASKQKGYNDDPFVQYFSSLIFESVGQRSDARICRENALNAYQNLGGLLRVSAPEFTVPANADELGEVITALMIGFILENGNLAIFLEPDLVRSGHRARNPPRFAPAGRKCVARRLDGARGYVGLSGAGTAAVCGYFVFCTGRRADVPHAKNG